MGRLVLIYDDRCGLCRAWIGWLTRRDVDKVFTVLPCQSVERQLRYPGMASEDCLKEFKVIDSEGMMIGGGAAIPVILRELPHWRIVGKILSVSLLRPFLLLGYRFLAQNRFFLTKMLGKW